MLRPHARSRTCTCTATQTGRVGRGAKRSSVRPGHTKQRQHHKPNDANSVYHFIQQHVLPKPAGGAVCSGQAGWLPRCTVRQVRQSGSEHSDHARTCPALKAPRPHPLAAPSPPRAPAQPAGCQPPSPRLPFCFPACTCPSAPARWPRSNTPRSQPSPAHPHPVPFPASSPTNNQRTEPQLGRPAGRPAGHRARRRHRQRGRHRQALPGTIGDHVGHGRDDRRRG